MITRHPTRSGEFVLQTEQWIAQPIETVFAFFADAFQLEHLTPSFLSFRVITPAPIQIATGTLIDYRLRLRGLPIRWRSRISVWEPIHRFVDEQVHGPYRRWYHEHTFESRDGGTLVGDRVEYSILGGAVIHSLFVRRDLERIFQYRAEALDRILGTHPKASGEEPVPLEAN